MKATFFECAVAEKYQIGPALHEGDEVDTIQVLTMYGRMEAYIYCKLGETTEIVFVTSHNNILIPHQTTFITDNQFLMDSIEAIIHEHKLLVAKPLQQKKLENLKLTVDFFKDYTHIVCMWDRTNRGSCDLDLYESSINQYFNEFPFAKVGIRVKFDMGDDKYIIQCFHDNDGNHMQLIKNDKVLVRVITIKTLSYKKILTSWTNRHSLVIPIFGSTESRLN